MTASHRGGIPYYDVSPQRGYPSFLTTVYIGDIPFHDVNPPPRQLLTGRWVRVRLKLRVSIFLDSNPPTPSTTLHLDGLGLGLELEAIFLGFFGTTTILPPCTTWLVAGDVSFSRTFIGGHF